LQLKTIIMTLKTLKYLHWHFLQQLFSMLLQQRTVNLHLLKKEELKSES
jgi:hypothetical protein